MAYKTNKNMRSLIVFSTLLIFSLSNLYSNNIIISVSSVFNRYSLGGVPTDHVNVFLSWDNHYHNGIYSTPRIRDGAYIFLKYRIPNGNVYPLQISIYEPPSNPDVEWINIGQGFIFTKNTLASGIFSESIEFEVIGLPKDADILAYAVEMVEVTPWNINFGDGYDGTVESTFAFHADDNFRSYGNILRVDANGFDDSAIEAPNYINVNNGISNAPINNPQFPGVNRSFWCMKYEITQGAYRDFLNTLTLTQQTTRTANSPTSPIGTGALTTSGTNRNYIEIKTPSIAGQSAIYGCDANGNNIFDEASDGEYIACNFLSWMDIAAWLDWAGMAPMTEIQYELACNRLSGLYTFDYAWGHTLHTTPLTLVNVGAANEGISNSSATLGNANFLSSAINGPIRNGIFSTATSNTRKKSGSTVWGIMEMSGNLREACVTVGNVAGRSFNKSQTNFYLLHGNGILSANGNALVNYWPGNVASSTSETIANAEVNSASGTIARGGSFLDTADKLTKADRSQGEVPTTRTAGQGGRGILYIDN